MPGTKQTDKPKIDPKSIHILLADDNRDDRFFFKDALGDLTIPTVLTTVEDGERLLTYLNMNTVKLPDVLFLDINMPRINGSECLKAIKLNKLLQNLPVIIYSTSLPELVADELYKNKAHYYVPKTNLSDLKKVLKAVLTMIVDKKFDRPPRSKFMFGMAKA
ncbi:MAG: rcp1 2 [Bacteroidetes bacterium]|jgi:CheY-like chemotaxis protein|nr:rcp1 2 [Bacteroidota bacterium]MDF2451857.1 rcp1 2 [Bacteroidota bacterium]